MAASAATGAAAVALPGLGQTVLSLGLVLLLIFGLAALLKRLQGLRAGGSGMLRLHGGLQVGPKERVLIIEAGGKHLLIGVAPGAVSTLHVFDAPPSAPDLPATAPPLAGAFRDALNRALGREPRP